MSVGKESYLTIKLDHDDWDYDKGGWEFPVLLKLDAEITSVKLNRRLLNSNRYNLNESGDVIRVTNDYNDDLWEPETAKLSVTIKFTKGLSTQEETDKWKLFSIILGPIATVLAAIIAFNKPTTTVIAKPTAIPTVTVTAIPTVAATSLPTDLNPFDNELYPKLKLYPRRECGIVNGRPVYPVFIPYSSIDFTTVKREFCKDASYLGGESNRVLIASFSDENNADMFVAFIGKHFKGAWKGKGE